MKGRFLTEDSYWNISNMIYGDDPYKIYGYQDPLGQDISIYAPNMSAIRQSSNLYQYALNNPLFYRDSSGMALDLIQSFYNVLADPISGKTGLILLDIAVSIIFSGTIDAKAPSLDATTDLTQYAGKVYKGKRDAGNDFRNENNKSTLEKHFKDHGADFNYESTQHYITGARNFFDKNPTSTIQSFVSEEGTYFRYDSATNEFGIINKFGGISTYYKPDDGMDYWLRQIKKYAPKE